jgi:hypothetical protein
VNLELADIRDGGKTVQKPVVERGRAGEVDISFKDDVTVILHLGIFFMYVYKLQ